MTSIDSGQPANRPAPLGELRSIFRRRRRQIVITFLLTLGIIALATWLAPEKYQAHMKILVRNQRASIIVTNGVEAQLSQPNEVSETEINTEIELLSSYDLLRQVVTASGLANEKGEPNVTPAEAQRLAVERAVVKLQRDLKISPARKTDVIEVIYTSENPRKAVEVLRQLTSSYLEYHLRVHGSPGTRDFFLQEASRYQNDLKEIESKLTNFRLKNDIVLFQDQKSEIMKQAEDANSALLAADAAIRDYAGKIADEHAKAGQVPSRMITLTRTLTNQNSVERFGSMLLELQNRRTQLLAKFRPDDRTVQEVSQEITDTQTALDKAKAETGSEQATDINPIRQNLELDLAKNEAEYAGLLARRKELASQSAAYRIQLYKLANSTTGYDDLSRTQKEAEENYLLYARKAEEARIADSLDQHKISNVAIAETPVEPTSPSEPNRPRNLALGTLLAGFLSLGIAFCAEYLSQPFFDVQIDSKAKLAGPDPSNLFGDLIQKPSELEAHRYAGAGAVGCADGSCNPGWRATSSK
ncbi:MAG: Wzz/FepE/Etk N-terminal domain-containing protein [Acidobacteriota bacterium]|nr:Wzz/FepE/Etk N-terminal domain-containing protein [Acidobacteriota bacterium]